MLKEAMKNMQAGAGNGDKNGVDGSINGNKRNGNNHNGHDGSADIPPGLMEALGEALNDDDFKKTLEQIGKSLGDNPNQVRVGVWDWGWRGCAMK